MIVGIPDEKEATWGEIGKMLWGTVVMIAVVYIVMAVLLAIPYTGPGE
jgi:hypothetical protein